MKKHHHRHRKPKYHPSPLQRVQRELAWLLYITEGYQANIYHAVAVNAYTLDKSALALMERAADSAAGTADELRAFLKSLPKE